MEVVQVETTQVDNPAGELVNHEPPPLSVQDHAAVYGPKAAEKTDAAAPEGETPAEKAIRLHHSAQQRREKQTGQFASGKVSRRETPEERAQIDQLTKRIWKVVDEAGVVVPRMEGESDRVYNVRRRVEVIERHSAAVSELARLKSQGASAETIRKAEQKVERAEARVESTPSTFNEPEPDENDPKFEGDYAKYMRAVAAWEGRKAYHGEKQAERESQQKAQREQSERESLTAAGKRFDAAKTKYPDFEVVAFSGSARIPEGSPVDLFIMEDELGPDVLYHLNKHPQELDSILQMTALQQVRRLVAIATELSPKSPATGSTTAVSETKKPVILPKPPTVVRTEAQRASDGPPPTDGSLSTAEHRKLFSPKRR
jgi:hypothetical protein